MLGYTPDEYVGHNISDFHADADVVEDILKRLNCREILVDYQADCAPKTAQFGTW